VTAGVMRLMTHAKMATRVWGYGESTVTITAGPKPLTILQYSISQKSYRSVQPLKTQFTSVMDS